MFTDADRIKERIERDEKSLKQAMAHIEQDRRLDSAECLVRTYAAIEHAGGTLSEDEKKAYLTGLAYLRKFIAVEL